MASPVPAKSQPLHNFSLPHLKWKKNHTTSNHHRSRSRLADSSPPHQSPPSGASRPQYLPSDAAQQQPSPSDASRRQSSPSSASRRHTSPFDTSRQQSSPSSAFPRQSSPLNTSRRQSSPSSASHRQSPLLNSAPIQSPMRDLESESDLTYFLAPQKHKNSAPEVVKTAFSVSSSDHEKSEGKKMESKFVFTGVKDKRSKIRICYRKNKPDDAVPDDGREKASTVVGEEEESLPKTWNLRPRRPPSKQFGGSGNGNGGTPKLGRSSLQENRTHEKKDSVNTVEKKEKKHIFCMALSRQEIEEDIYALTGSKPSRRPKKRPRTVQKQLDNLYPGLWLGCITPDLYKVSEAPVKG